MTFAAGFAHVVCAQFFREEELSGAFQFWGLRSWNAAAYSAKEE